jgi:hypothetical protein
MNNHRVEIAGPLDRRGAYRIAIDGTDIANAVTAAYITFDDRWRATVHLEIFPAYVQLNLTATVNAKIEEIVDDDEGTG